MEHTLIVIGGSTASGKTRLAIDLALKYDTEIISADSRQCYREISIGTAKPTKDELESVKHHFINSHSIHDYFSSGVFALEATQLLNKLFKEKKTVIMAGGSGLYIKALLEGLDNLPEVPQVIRDKLNEDYIKSGLSSLLEELKKHDPEYFQKVDRNNHARIIRALEIIRTTNTSYSSFLGKEKKTHPFRKICIAPELPRELLYQRINIRVDKMIEDGLVDEVKSVLPYRSYPALSTVGYKELFDYFDETYTLEEAIAKIKQHTRNYAKRQETWFRNQGDFQFLKPEIISDPEKWLFEE